MSLSRRILFPLVSLFVGLTVALVLAEVLLRITGLAPSQNLHSVTKTAFKQIPGVWSPGQDLVSSQIRELPHRIKTNWAGYRGREFAKEKKPNELRILITGDSFTFGSHVDDDETMPFHLERHLGSVCTGREVTVLNAGLGGSTIVSQAEVVRRGLSLKPDLVAVVFHGNDLEDLRNPIWHRMANNRELKSQFPMSLLWPLLRNTALWNLGLRLKDVLRVQANEGETKESPTSDDKLKRTYREVLLNLAGELNRKKQAHVFIGYPGHRTIKGEPTGEPIKWAVQTATAANIPTFNLLESLRKELASSVDAGFLLPHDGHPSKLGHGIAGKAVAKFLMSQPVIAAACKQP